MIPRIIMIAGELIGLVGPIRALIKACRSGDVDEAKAQADAIKVEAERIARKRARGG